MVDMHPTIHEATYMAFERYKAMLVAKKIKPENRVDTNPLSLEHGYWMVETALKTQKKSDYSLDKLSRWLGFVQAIVILHKLTTVNAERDITRPWFKAPAPAQ